MSNNKLFLIAIGGILVTVVLLTVIVLFKSFGGESAHPVTLEFWGVFDDSSFYGGTIGRFQEQHPNIKINYRKFSFEEYEKQLINAFASGRGPDIWMMHNTWLPKHKDKIAPLPQNIKGHKEPLMTLLDFRNQFVEVAENDLVLNGEIYALPIYVDTLAMYYNRDILNSAGITKPPSTWDELNETVKKITKIGANNQIVLSGAALGTSRNINRSTDILSLLMLQSGVPLAESRQTGANFSRIINNKNTGEVALEYYTDFSNPKSSLYTWSTQSDYSIDAFREGKAAIMFNYSHHIQTLRSKTPRFNFGISQMPQIKGGTVVNYANYWAPTVSKSSLFTAESWEFLAFLSSRDGVTAYINASKRPPARRDMVDAIRNDVDFGVFAVQTLSARSWYQADNAAIEVILADMIDDVNFNRRSVKDALRFAESQVNLLIFKLR